MRVRAEEILHQLVDRYLGDDRPDFARWLLTRAADEVAIAISPRSIFSWDYEERMGRAA